MTRRAARACRWVLINAAIDSAERGSAACARPRHRTACMRSKIERGNCERARGNWWAALILLLKKFVAAECDIISLFSVYKYFIVSFKDIALCHGFSQIFTEKQSW